MKRRNIGFRKLYTAFLALLFSCALYSQTYILNEDFSSASGTTPPTGWVNTTVAGEAEDLWHFDNPGSRVVNYPMIGTFAIFDSEGISKNQVPENVILETPYFDATISANILFSFDHYFVGGTEASGTIEVYDGTDWQVIQVYTDTTGNSEKEILDISAYAGSVPNSKIRFRWQGDSIGYWAVDNLSIYTPLPTDAGITSLDNPMMPFPAGTHPIEVSLANFGANTITSTTINWSVNGVGQSPHPWAGSLTSGTKESNIDIGSYSFVSGQKTVFKIWQTDPNGEPDGYSLNDTLTKTLYTALCGTYTVGGTSPDFENFTEVATALNNAGVACPVIFDIRDGIYDEQIKLYEISGSSATNTITFRGESGDSSLVELHYTTSNPSNDFTLAITGSDYISFEDMGILRTNGTNSVLIQNESNNVRFESCRLGNVVSPNTSVDGNLTFRYNNMEGYDLNLQHPDNTLAGEVIVENNFVRNLTITNSGLVSVIGNRILDEALYAQDITINRSNNITVSENRARQIYLSLDTTVAVLSNTILKDDSRDDNRGIYITQSDNLQIRLNIVSVKGDDRIRVIESSASRDILIEENNIHSYGNDVWSMGIAVNGTASHSVRILNNTISCDEYDSSTTLTKYGIYVDNGDSIYISDNNIDGLNLNKEGTGISVINVSNVLEADRNVILNFKTRGIFVRAQSDNWKLRDNIIKNAGNTGIYIEGTGGIFTNNEINGVSAGDGIHILASGTTVTENKTIGVIAGTGIIVNGANNLVANNFVQAEGVGIAKGISLQENGTGSQIVFNSINITGTDVANGVGLEVLGGNNYTVKNNIFANPGGGLAAKLDLSIAGSDWDYNDFYSSGDEFGSNLGTLYSDLGSWGAAINADANSNLLNPFYLSETELRPSQRSINGAGIAAAGIALDIDGEVRNLAAPDVGADEYLVDFGITQLVSPTLSCGLGTSDSVTILLRQFGDVPFIDLQVAYTVNGGPVNIGTVPGEISNDIQFTFPSTEDLAGHGTYDFKVWLIGSHDDNINNDTLEVSRYSSDVPDVDFSFTSDCAGTDIPFTGTASVATGSITNYEWLFGDGDTATVQNPLHAFPTSGQYNVTLRAYTDIGCYGDIAKEVDLLTTPQAAFIYTDACYGEEVIFENNSSVESGSLSYDWNFGDGDLSILASPTHQYGLPGKYEVELIATAPSGCSSSSTDSVEMFTEIYPNLATSTDSAWVNITGGTAPYEILWENGQTGMLTSNLVNGWRSVTITDANSCSVTDSVEVSIPELQFSVIGTDASCGSCTDGSAEIVINQGVAPFYYQWSNGSTIETASDLMPGWYYVTVRDAYLNPVEDSIYIDGGGSILISLEPTHLTCFEGGNGSIDLTVSGGVSPYAILWSNGASTEDITDLSAGIYTVRVTDSNSMIDSSEVELTEPDELLVTSVVESVSCAGEATGVIELTTSGGVPPYQYSWSNGSTDQDQTGLLAGDYEVTITDANACIFIALFTLTEPELPLTAMGIVIDVSCMGEASGIIILNTTGGVKPYQYSWSNGSTNQHQIGLLAGEYELTVTDANGCAFISEFTVSEPASMLAASGTLTDVACTGEATGGIQLAVTGGVAPYRYNWSNGSTDQNQSELLAGEYEVIITDAHGCTYTMQFIISEPPSPLAATASVTDVICTGEANGGISLSVTGGIAPYEFSWSNGSIEQNLSGLLAGEYEVVVTDANGCIYASQFIVNEPALLVTAAGVVTDVRCMGEANGSIIFTPTGGVAPYQFSWSNGSVEQNQNGLLAGDYELTLTDANGCTFSTLFTISEPASPLTTTGIVTNVNCMGEASGSIHLTISGGITPYEFNWSNGSTNQDLSGLLAGEYEVGVTDAGGCIFTTQFTVSEPDSPVSATASITEVSCTGEADGGIVLTTSGGLAPYQYNWSNGSTDKDQNGLLAGDYEISITDASGCIFTGQFTVNEPVALVSVSGIVTDVACKGEATGSIVLSVSGGTAPYQFNWSNGSTNQDQDMLLFGVYDVMITDDHGCEYSTSFTVSEPEANLYVTGMVTDMSCTGEANGSIAISVAGGASPYQYSWSNGSADQNQTGLLSGVYELTVTDANGCISTWQGEVKEQSKALISGTAIFSGGFINVEDADVRLLDASSHPFRLVSEVRMGVGGSFVFTDVPEGLYTIFVKLDDHAKQTYKGVMHSYYGKTHRWQEAELIQLSCEDNEELIVEMFENPASENGNGNGKASGTCKYESNILKGLAMPVPYAYVLLIDEFSGLPIDYLSTDESGTFSFLEIANGDYSLYVDIPGITMTSTHYFSITDSIQELNNLDFIVDAIFDLDINSVINTSISEDPNISYDLSIYPNPTNSNFVILESEVFDQEKVEIIMISELGSVISQRDIYVAGEQIKMDISGLAPGNYILRIVVENVIQNRKLIITE